MRTPRTTTKPDPMKASVLSRPRQRITRGMRGAARIREATPAAGTKAVRSSIRPRRRSVMNRPRRARLRIRRRSIQARRSIAVLRSTRLKRSIRRRSSITASDSEGWSQSGQGMGDSRHRLPPVFWSVLKISAQAFRSWTFYPRNRSDSTGSGTEVSFEMKFFSTTISNNRNVPPRLNLTA